MLSGCNKLDMIQIVIAMETVGMVNISESELRFIELSNEVIVD